MNNWQDFQAHSYRDWNYFYDTKENFDVEGDIPFKELVAKSSPIETYNLNIVCKPWDDIDIFIETNASKSNIYFSFAVNKPQTLWWFLESLLRSSKEVYCYINEEGVETFFYVEHLENKKIRFVHISNSFKDSDYEPFMIRHDLIINKFYFIDLFSEQLFNVIGNKTTTIKKYYGKKDYNAYVRAAAYFRRTYEKYKKEELL